MKIINVGEGMMVIDALAKMFNLVHDKKESAAMHLNGVMIIMFMDEKRPMIQVPVGGFMPPDGNFGTE